MATRRPNNAQVDKARETLNRRSTRVAATRGRRSKAFIKDEVRAVYILARRGASFEAVAKYAGLSADDMRQAVKLDPEIGRAYDTGRADLLLDLVGTQVDIALDATQKAADRTRAFNAVREALGEGGGKGGTSVSVAITNELQVAGAMDVRRYQAMVGRLNQALPDKRGETIDVRPGPPVVKDPVRAALGKPQRGET